MNFKLPAIKIQSRNSSRWVRNFAIRPGWLAITGYLLPLKTSARQAVADRHLAPKKKKETQPSGAVKQASFCVEALLHKHKTERRRMREEQKAQNGGLFWLAQDVACIQLRLSPSAPKRPTKPRTNTPSSVALPLPLFSRNRQTGCTRLCCPSGSDKLPLVDQQK